MTVMAIHTLPRPQSIIIGVFLFLLAVAFAVAPLQLVFRSLGILFATLLVFSVAGMPFAYLTALLAPVLGLINGDMNWLIMLPIVMVSLLLTVLGLEFSWRYPAIVVVPLLCVLPQFIAWQLSRQALFEIELPWEPASNWVGLHALMALAGVLIAVYFDRRRAKRVKA